MCGLAGEILWNQQMPSAAPWQKISSMMKNRGPDEEGILTGAGYTFVFRRLSILDLSAWGHQPMSHSSGRYHLCFNGELYNFRELRHELSQKGIVFHSTGDTEVVLQSLVHWGKGAFKRFNGMYAISFFDQQLQKLILAVDHCGIKPLYYHVHQHGVFFASQLNQVIAYQPQLQSDVYGVSDSLQFGFSPGPSTIFKNTFKLMPGELIEFTKSSTSHTQYWQFSSAALQPNTYPSQSEIIAKLYELLPKVLERQSLADVPINTFLSGGIDSALVNTFLKKIPNRNFSALTMSIDDDLQTEKDAAAQIACSLSIPHLIRTISLREINDKISTIVDAMYEPLADISIIPTFLICELAAKESKVILSGDGGDELFWGYPGRMSKAINITTTFKQPWFLRHFLGQFATLLNLNRATASMYPTVGHWYQEIHSVMIGTTKNQIFPTLEHQPLSPYFNFNSTDADQIANTIRGNESFFHLRRVLLKVDQASMANSLEVRVPLLDRELMEFASCLHYSACIDPNNHIAKLPLRSILKNEINYNNPQKKGFDLPTKHWLTKDLKPLILDTLNGRRELLGQQIDAKPLNRLLNDFYHHHIDLSPSIWNLFVHSLWEDRHLHL